MLVLFHVDGDSMFLEGGSMKILAAAAEDVALRLEGVFRGHVGSHGAIRSFLVQTNQRAIWVNIAESSHA